MKSSLCVALFAAAIALVISTSISQAAVYSFLNVASTGTSTSQFTSSNGNGFINVSHTFSPGGAGASDNVNTAIFPSQFLALFPGTGQVQGHLAQTVYNHTSVVTFDLTNYNLSSSTVFGVWNTSDEVPQPAYRIELIDAGNNPVAPTTFNLIGNQDNETQVAGRSQLLLNTLTGDLSAGAVINAGGTHTNAAFWDSIPAGTKQIIVYGNLPPLNNIGDGVGYYFAEVVPEPSSIVLAGLGLLALGSYGAWRRRRVA
jgi:MYXO-CTERM domain-containing protein